MGTFLGKSTHNTMYIPADSTVPVSSGDSVPPSAGAGSREDTTTAEIVIVPESDDEVQFLGSSLPQSSLDQKSRLACVDHPSTSSVSNSHSPSSSTSPHSSTSMSTSIVCPVCMDHVSVFKSSGRELMTTTCGHIFCDVCIRNAISSFHKCPVCNKKLSIRQYHRLYIS